MLLSCENIFCCSFMHLMLSQMTKAVREWKNSSRNKLRFYIDSNKTNTFAYHEEKAVYAIQRQAIDTGITKQEEEKETRMKEIKETDNDILRLLVNPPANIPNMFTVSIS